MRAALLLFVALPACGPIQSGTLLVDAQAELAAAHTAQADKHSPFEYIAAEEYLHKAREEQSYSEFELAVDFARKARDCARVARMKAEAATRAQIGTTDPVQKTTARCRPGPERMKMLPDADQEPAAIEPPAPAPVKKAAPAKKKAEPKKAAPAPAEPADPPERKVVTPKDEPLPEGDE